MYCVSGCLLFRQSLAVQSESESESESEREIALLC